MKLTSVKIDCRNNDGAINKVTSAYFLSVITNGKHELYCGNACNNLKESVEHAMNSEFLMVNEKGMISLCDDEDYFKSHAYVEVLICGRGDIVKREEAIDPIVAAVDVLKGDLSSTFGSNNSRDTHVLLCDDGDYITDTLDGHDDSLFTCTIEQFNQCVKEMSLNKWGQLEFDIYSIHDKQLLTKENSDYSHYKGEESDPIVAAVSQLGVRGDLTLLVRTIFYNHHSGLFGFGRAGAPNAICSIEEFDQCVREMTGCAKEHQAWLTALNDMREDEKQSKRIGSLSQYSDAELLSECVSRIDGKETAEQKDKLGDEWVNGDKCIYENDECMFVGSSAEGNIVIQYEDTELLIVRLHEISKPETAEQKEIRAQIKVLNNTLEVQTKSLQQIKQSQSDLIDSNVCIAIQINELEDKL